MTAYCTEDADCAAAACDQLCLCDASEDGQWGCHEELRDTCITNPNGTINTYCTRLCTTDDECRERFGDPDFFCQKLSQNPADWGCILPPATSGCPDALPPFLEGDDLAYARCSISLGTNQERCLKFEQGLEASRLALDSDEDDCSAAAAIGEEHYETCAFLSDTRDGGPLVPVADYAAFLRALKPAGRVSVLASVGLADADSEAEAQAIYDAYVASKDSDVACFHQTYLCQGPTGSSDWGKRYYELAQAFGADGAVDNLCHLGVGDVPVNAIAVVPDASELELGYRHKLAPFADRLLANARRICLPRDGKPTVTLVRADVETPIDADALSLEHDVAGCPSGVALVPRAAFQNGDRLRIDFR